MPEITIDRIRSIKSFPSLVKYLRDELNWPLDAEDVEDLTFEYDPQKDLGLDPQAAVKVKEIKQLRPFTHNQPWGIFYISFEPKRLPVVVLRRILSDLVIKKRVSANKAQRVAWNLHDLLFISAYGESEERTITFAHFSEDKEGSLPTLRVIGWDDQDTPLHLAHCIQELNNLGFDEDLDAETWRKRWSSAFTLRHREVITTSKALAVRLAMLARAIRNRILAVLEIETEEGPVTELMKAFREALVHDLDEGNFADMYAQTIAYGLLSARVENPSGDTVDDFSAQMPVTNPFLKELLETCLHVGGRKGGVDFDELGVSEVVELLDDANMEAVVRDFGDRKPQEDPVIHFYELFLKEYDAKQRLKRGVFYTPRPVVSFIVRSVDELLRTEFGLEDGLADISTWGEMVQRHEDLEIPEGASPDQAFVQILDPATGTGTFLVEVIEEVHKTMSSKWKKEGMDDEEIKEAWNEYVPNHLLPRLHGYELLMAPYAIAHMKIGLKLHETGYRFDSDERARVYLTNALEPATEGEIQEDLFEDVPALAHEAEAVNVIKRDQRFTVVIGNPPYSISSQNRSEWILSLLASYKRGIDDRKHNLDDDYIKFWRYVHWLAEGSPNFIGAMITNHSFIAGVGHRRMRESWLSDFSRIYVTDLHGNSLIGEVSPGGLPNENVFDIQNGVAITVAVRQADAPSPCSVKHRDLWGSRDAKYTYLSRHVLAEVGQYSELSPREPFFFFESRDESLASEFRSWRSVNEMFFVSNTGIQTKRDELFVDFCAEELSRRMQRVLNAIVEKGVDAAEKEFRLPSSTGWSIRKLCGSKFSNQKVQPIHYRPLDVRYIYYDKHALGRARFNVMQHMIGGENFALIFTRQFGGKRHFIAYCTDRLIEMSTQPFASYKVFPAFKFGADSGFRVGERSSNVQPEALAEYISSLPDVDGEDAPRDFCYFAYAVAHSPTYRERYKELLKSEFPRIPLRCSRLLAGKLTDLGGDLVALHLMESTKLDDHITTLVGSSEFQVEKISYSDETVWLDRAKTRGFQGVPEEVWNFHIGGYQVCEKWLKDRQAKGGKNPRPGRVLTDEDIDHYQKIVAALNETIRLMGEIDEVIEEHGGWPDAFQGPDSSKL